MRKIVVIFLIFICLGCNNKFVIEDKQDKIDDSYIEILEEDSNYFISKLSDNEILLNQDEIKEYNNIIESKTDSLYNLNINSLTKNEVLNYINKYKLPNLPKYNNGVLITNNDIKNILDNRNIENIPDIVNLKKGIIVNRTNLKSNPTDMHFFDSITDTNFDALQETELKVNTPVLIIHESKDLKYLFVLSKTYIGWVKSDDIAFSSDDDIEYFTNNKNFIVITEPFIEINNTLLDMGVTLPLIKPVSDGYLVSLPTKDENGNIKVENVTISKDKTHVGYLPYTKKNVLIESFKYEGIPYSWGSMDYGVDCSGYVRNIYSTFGFVFPRNTSDQNNSVGILLDLSDKSSSDKLNIIEKNVPSLLYMEGHVLIYIGIKDNKHYVINASGNKLILKVTKEVLEDSYYLPKLEKLVLIEKN